MKKIIAILLAALLCFACVACAGNSGKEAESTTPASEGTDLGDKVFNVGIVQLIQHEALDAATKGFQDKLSELVGADHVKFNYQNAAGESATCATIVNQFVSDKVDLILANATPALQAAVTATQDIPILGTSITDYATALDIADWTGKTGINVSGTSDCPPLEEQAKMYAELLPVDKFPVAGLIYCSSEANSKYQCDKVEAALKEAGYETKVYTFADSNDLSSVLNKAVTEIDGLYIPTDNICANNTSLIDSIVSAAKIPVIAGEEGIAKGCGIATLSISYYDLGVATAQLAYDILVGGKDAADIEIAYAANVVKEYVKERADALEITVPDDYTAIEAKAAE